MVQTERARDRYLVTGAGGYVGRRVVRELSRRGLPVTAVGRHDLSGVFADLPRVRVLVSDALTPSPELDEALEEAAVLTHLAWTDGFVLNSRSHALSLSRHYELLTRAVDLGVTTVAAAGTMHEIGYWEGAVNDETPTRPVSLYGIAKDALRRLLFASAPQPEVTKLWLRFYYIYGDDLENNSIFTKILHAANEGKREFPFTSGTNQYDFIHVDQLARQIAAAVTQREVSGVINCSSGLPEPLGSRVEAFIQDNDLRLSLAYGAFPDRPFDSPAIWGDTAKIDRIMSSRGDRDAPNAASQP